MYFYYIARLYIQLFYRRAQSTTPRPIIRVELPTATVLPKISIGFSHVRNAQKIQQTDSGESARMQVIYNLYTESKTIAILFRSECDYEKYTDIRSVLKSAFNSNTDLVWTASGDCMTGSSTPRPRYTLSFLPLLVHYRRLHLSFPLHGIRPDLGYCWVDVFGTCRNQKNHQF